ncbi:MAG: hypothetical protein HYZ15_11015 [Sphingobacteriales bacterium]|nr:hypothetical protein [Sphingobacteriales bacterium]
MKYFFAFLFCLSLTQIFCHKGHAQIEAPAFQVIKPPATAVVPHHKDNLKLTLIVDSIFIGQKKIIPHFSINMPISFESDYIQVKDNLYLKIFIARNQEYGAKFYTWKWDFLNKKNGKFYSQGVSSYEMMDFNGSIDVNTSQGHGVGLEDTPEYVMYYYRYKLE